MHRLVYRVRCLEVGALNAVRPDGQDSLKGGYRRRHSCVCRTRDETMSGRTAWKPLPLSAKSTLVNGRYFAGPVRGLFFMPRPSGCSRHVTGLCVTSRDKHRMPGRPPPCCDGQAVSRPAATCKQSTARSLCLRSCSGKDREAVPDYRGRSQLSASCSSACARILPALWSSGAQP